MKKLIIILLLISSSAFAGECKITPYFSPYEQVAPIIISQIENAKSFIHCSLYGITNADITAALVKSKKSGIDISLCLDKMQSAGRASTHMQLQKAGIDIEIKKQIVLEHNKFCVFDNNTVIMGSWNFSGNAQKQDNSDVLFENCPDIAAKFISAFDRIHKRDK